MFEVWTGLATAAARIAKSRKSSRRRLTARRGNQESHDLNPGRSIQDVCEHLAANLDANAIVIERLRGEPLVVAGAPWKAEVSPIDKIALDWSFTTGLPPKAGMGNPFGTDWLFLPVKADDRVVAVLGVMARYGRRRFILQEQPAIRNSLTALERIYRTTVSN